MVLSVTGSAVTLILSHVVKDRSHRPLLYIPVTVGATPYSMEQSAPKNSNEEILY